MLPQITLDLILQELYGSLFIFYFNYSLPNYRCIFYGKKMTHPIILCMVISCNQTWCMALLNYHNEIILLCMVVLHITILFQCIFMSLMPVLYHY